MAEWKDQDLFDPQVFGHDSCLGCSTIRWSDRPPGVSPAFGVTLRLWRLAVEIQQTDTYSGELTSLEPRADSSTSRAPVRETGVKERAKDRWRKTWSRFKKCKVKLMAQLPWQRRTQGGQNPWLLTPSRSPGLLLKTIILQNSCHFSIPCSSPSPAPLPALSGGPFTGSLLVLLVQTFMQMQLPVWCKTCRYSMLLPSSGAVPLVHLSRLTDAVSSRHQSLILNASKMPHSCRYIKFEIKTSTIQVAQVLFYSTNKALMEMMHGSADSK